MRLADRSGTVDPRELDELPEEVWVQWHALSLVDDWGHDKFASLAAAIHNSLMLAASKMGGSVKKSDFRTDDTYERRFAWERKRPKRQTAAEQEALTKSWAGF